MFQSSCRCSCKTKLLFPKYRNKKCIKDVDSFFIRSVFTSCPPTYTLLSPNHDGRCAPLYYETLCCSTLEEVPFWLHRSSCPEDLFHCMVFQYIFLGECDLRTWNVRYKLSVLLIYLCWSCRLFWRVISPVSQWLLDEFLIDLSFNNSFSLRLHFCVTFQKQHEI